MDPRLRHHPVEASPHLLLRRFAALLTRLAVVGLLALAAPLSAHAQARPNIQWMHGAIAGNLEQLAVSSDTQTITLCGDDGTAKIRRLSDGMLLQTINDGTVDTNSATSVIYSTAYTPDGTKMATGGYLGVIHIWDVATGTLLHTLTTPGTVYSIAISSDGAYIAAGLSTNDILVWNLSDYSTAATLGGHTNSVNSVAFSPDHQHLVSGSSDGNVRTWNVADWSQLKTMSDGNTVTRVAFSADNKTVCSGDHNGTVKLWNGITGGNALYSLTGLYGGVNFAFSSDGSRLAIGYPQSDTKLHLVRGTDLGALLTVDTKFNIASVVYSADGTQIFCSDVNSNVTAWAPANLASLGSLSTEDIVSVNMVTSDPTGAFVASSSSTGIIKFRDAATGAQIRAITPDFTKYINAFAFSRDGSTLAVAGIVTNPYNGGVVSLFRTSDGSLIRSLSLTASSLAFSKDGTLLAVASGSTINVYTTAGFALQYTLAGTTNYSINAITISPDGTLIAAAQTNGKTLVWNLSTRSLLWTLSKHTGSIGTVAFSTDSALLIDSSSDNTSVLWRMLDGGALQTFTHTEPLNTAALSPDGRQAITGGDDRRLRIWDTTSGALLYDYTQETGAPTNRYALNGLTSASYSPDGKFVYYGRDDATIVKAVNPLFTPLITGLSISPSTIVSGGSTTGIVTLNTTTLAGGAVIVLSSSSPGVASVPTSVIVPPGAATASFTITGGSVAAQSMATITASLNGSSAGAVVTVTAPTVSGLTISPTSVKGGQNATGTVSLTGPAPAGGISVALSCNNSNAIVPAGVLVPANSTTGTFTIPTNVVGTQNTATISANLGGSATATLTITPPTITALSVSPANLQGGKPSTGTVTISDPAPSGGILINLSSNNTAAATTGGSVTVAAGATTATFAITTKVVNTVTSVTFTASFAGSTKTTVLTVTPPTVSSVTLNPAGVKGGLTSTGTVTLSDPAATGGQVVNLSSANSALAGVPATITVPAGSTTGTFTVTTSPVATDTPVVLTAAIGSSNATGTLTVQAPLVASLAVNPLAVYALQSATLTVTLDGPAPTGGIVVSLFSSNSAVATPPTTVTIAAGSIVGTATVTTFSVPADTPLLFAATLGTSNQSVHFTVLKPLPAPINFFWRNSSSGEDNFWQLNGTSIVNLGQMLSVPDLAWKIVAAADFFHKGNVDVIWRNDTTGDVVYWDVKDGVVQSSGYIYTVADKNWKIVGAADLLHQGTTGLFWQNTSSGDLVYWEMNGATFVKSDYIKTLPDLNWRVAAVTDLFHAGNTDIVWQNSANGDIVYWDLNGTGIASSGYISTLTDKNWKVVGAADLFHQNHTDLIWQNNATGDVVYWDLTGAAITGSGYIYTVPNLQWKIGGVR